MKLKRLRQKGKAFYYDHGGKPRKWEPLGSVMSEAMRKYHDIENGKDSEFLTVGDLCRAYIASHQSLEPNTLRSYRLFLKIITEKCNLGFAPKTAINQSHLFRLYDQFQNHSTRNACLFVKTVYAWAVSRGYVNHSPFTGMRMKGQARRDRYLTHSEFLAAREHLPEKFKLAADLAYTLGLRVSELVKLKFSDFKDGVVTIQQKKVKKPKYQEITEDVKKLVERARTLPGAVRGLHLICQRTGQPYAEKTVSGAFQEALRNAGITDSRFHDIRAKSASDETDTATARLGHAVGSSSTKIYLRKPVVAVPIKGVK